MEKYSGAYIISRQRRGGGKPPRRGRHGAAALIALLLLLTAGIVFLVVILPRLPSGSKHASSGNVFVGRTFYLLSTGSAEDFTEAGVLARDATSRGGGGYIFNDGRYHAIAAVYERESEAKALAEINDGAYYLTLNIPDTDNATDAAIVKYICGDFFSALNDAATALDRGTITNAAADYIAFKSIMRLNNMVEDATHSLRFALDGVEYKSGGGDRTQLSYIRYVMIKALVGAYYGLTATA